MEWCLVKKAISSPPAECTDAFVYWIVNGYSGIGQENQSETDTRGDIVDGFQSQTMFYNGCTKDVAIAMALSTKYPNAETTINDEFNARFELWGNADTSTFELRALKFDGYKDGVPNFNTFLASGQASGTSGNLILGFASYTCNNSACASPSISTARRNYCLALSSTPGALSVDATVANCDDYETAFDALVLLNNGSATTIPRSVVDFTTAEPFGL
jgi:hypothetical protein